ncbi:MAG: isopentenyl transferase family protein [Patescibacteria group bacterium]
MTKPKVLIICGPTATGKTKMALALAEEFNGELISADSRQVYIGNDLETGKDKDIIGNIKIWLLDVVKADEDFSVSQWRKLAHEAIKDILSRDKLPIVVGGSGLYIKALVQNLPDVDIPQDEKLRNSNKSVSELFDYLKSIDLAKAESLNNSDRNNPRRLVRAIEIAQCPSPKLGEGLRVRYLQIGLTAPKQYLEEKIRKRVIKRGLDPSFVQKEINIMKKQLVWFKKQPDIVWFDIMEPCLEKLKSLIKP